MSMTAPSDAIARAAPECFIVMNQGSGANAKDEARQAIEAQLRSGGRRHRFVTAGSGDLLAAAQEAARLARESGGVLVAAGGDGTINCVAQAALAHDCPLGVIAQGTFNLFARQLGLPLEAGAAARALLRSRTEPVQVGWANQRTFLVNASLGLYPQLLADREHVKQKLGRRRWIAMLAALKSLFEWRREFGLDLEIDGEIRHLRTASVFIGNNRLQLARVGIPGEVVEQVGEGRLACVLVRPLRTWAKLRMAAAAAFGTLGEERAIDTFALRSLTVGDRRLRRIQVATDGEIVSMELPVRITVAPRPLQVLLPPREERLAPA